MRYLLDTHAVVWLLTKDRRLPKELDPFDRIIISTAIKRNMTLISADSKFPWYAEN